MSHPGLRDERDAISYELRIGTALSAAVKQSPVGL